VAGAVAEGIRTLHHLTLGPGDQLEGPNDVRDVIGALSLAVSRMPQLLGQLAVFLEIEQVKGTLAGQDSAEHVQAMAAALDGARDACERVIAAAPRPCA